MKHKIWSHSACTDKQAIKELSKQTNISEILATILFVRGIDNPEKVREYLSYVPKYNDPKLLKGVVQACERILQAIAKKECILIYGDYDVDGICSTSLLYRFLTDYLGADNVRYFIPSRSKEGYGLNTQKLLEMADDGVNLLVSVDCGISNFEAVDAVKGLMDVIITDHHQVPDRLPDAYAVVNPQQADCDYPFKSLAGVGVTFKLCQALWQIYKNDTTLYFDELLELVALATVADIVPLVDENRGIVKLGLERMQNSQILGIRELAKVSGYGEQRIMATSLGFNIAPRLNAVGRLGDANIAVRMLVSKQEDEARSIAEFLDTENISRQSIEMGILREAEEMFKQDDLPGCIILASESWNVGVIGIVSSKLVDKYYLPAILLSIDEQGIAKGSCRSIQALDIYKALQSMQHLLISFGGHHQAAGLSLHKDNIPQFRREFSEYLKQNLCEQDYQQVIRIDCEIENFSELDESLLSEMDRLEPCGFANHKPRLSASKVIVEKANSFSDGQHLRLALQKERIKKTATMWKGGSLAEFIKAGSMVDIAFNITLDNWQNINLNLLDVHRLIDFIDYRYSVCSLDDYLSMAADPNKLAIYDTEVRQTVRTLQYTDDLPPETTTLLITNVPTVDELQSLKQIISSSKRVLTIVFLFKKQQICALAETLEQRNIDREKLKKFFLLLKQKVEASTVLSAKGLLHCECFAEFNEDYLRILQELELINIDNDCIQFIPTANKRDLNDSLILKELSATYNRELEHLNNLKNKSMSELF
mgnify:FL=1